MNNNLDGFKGNYAEGEKKANPAAPAVTQCVKNLAAMAQLTVDMLV